jgi:L-ascorbate metabolism protein UlaG (beta-lactamase superfamily)
MKYKIMGLFLAAAGMFAADARGPASRPAADETAAIERSIRDFSSAAKEPAKARENTVTFVGISGFLVEVDGKKVLIDGLSNFTSPAVEQRLLAGEAPFDGLDLVLATHSHGDHFKAATVGRCLQNHPKAAFVAPPDAAGQVTGFPGRVFPVQAGEAKRTLLEVNGIRIQAMPLSHGTPPPGVPGIVNLGYLVTIGSVTFFHSGDIDPSRLTPELLRALGLPDERIDFAFVPGFFLAMPEPPPFVTAGIRPRVFIAAHLPPAGQEPLDEAGLRRNFPTAVLFKAEMDSWTIK